LIPAQSRFDWFFRYKLYHIPFWFFYHYVWWTVNIGSAWHAASNIFHSAYSFKYCFYVIFQAAGAYFNLYFLMPRLLEKGRYTLYLSVLLATILVTALLVSTGYYFSAWLSEKTFFELYGVDPKRYFYFFQNNTLPSTVASMTLAMSVKLTKNWIQSKQREQALKKEKLELAKEKLETELKFLKSQFNPHFLFNTINSIFVLIGKDPDMAAESLAKFSDILRYQLYECNEQEIPLAQELSYLGNYIELQKLRQDEGYVALDLQTSLPLTSNLSIAPFVLIPFVENAFKHVSRERGKANWISMSLALEGDSLHAVITNSVSQITGGEFIRHSGIGLPNVRRRLDLVYPGTHELVIDRNDAVFSVSLTLQLHERKLPERLTEAVA
jgi:two-component system, LytTR family, sensor kinase